jgi:acyl-CoA thioester hydrolase
MPDLQSTVRTFVNTWQCDENLHLNVQFFTSFAHDASAQLHARLGLGPAALGAARLRLRPVEDHVRYYRELRAEDIVEVRSAPVAVDDTTLAAYHEIRNAYDGTVAATVRCVTACRTAEGAAARWPKVFRANAEAATVALPSAAEARTAGKRGPLPDLTLAAARDLGLSEISRSQVMPAECGIDGGLLPRFHLARFSDGGAHLWQALGFDRAGMRDRRQGSVILESKLVYSRPLAAGSLCAVLSGLLEMSEKSMHLAHFLFDAEDGALVAKSEAVAVLFDQQARRTIAFSAADRARLADRKMKFTPAPSLRPDQD